MQAGETIANRFVIEARAGAGAMGVVYRARDLATGRAVAVKVMRSDDSDSLQRFARETEVLASLHHPNIVEYVTHGRTTRGEPYLVMEWLDGRSLKEALAERSLTFVEIIDVAMAIAGALVPAHARGIVHRDLKPGNVFLVDGAISRVKVVDFGIARVGGAGTLTGTGATLGTPAYMSPEQVTGARHVDGRSDLFSLGAVLFRCVAGRAPFEADEALAILLALSTTRAPAVRSVAPGTPPKLAALIDRMLEPNPAERPAEATIVLRALADARAEAGGLGVGAAPRLEATIGSGTLPTPASYGPAPVTGSSAPALGSRGSVATAPRSVGMLPLAIAVAGALALGGGAVALYVGMSQRSPKTTSARERSTEEEAPRKPVSTTDSKALACPPDALACETSPIEDPAKADPDELLGYARTAAKRQNPDAELVSLSITGLTDDGVDLRHGGVAAIIFSHDIMVHFVLDVMSVRKYSLVQASPIRLGCTLDEAYRKARAAGVPAKPAFMTISASQIVIARYTTDGTTEGKQAMFDAKCAPLY